MMRQLNAESHRGEIPGGFLYARKEVNQCPTNPNVPVPIPAAVGFLDDNVVRAVWDDEKSKWWSSVLDIIGVLRGVDDAEAHIFGLTLFLKRT